MNIIDELRRIIVPEIARLEQAISNLLDTICDLKKDQREFRKELSKLSNEVAALKGKYENAEETIWTRIENEFLKALVQKSGNLLKDK